MKKLIVILSLVLSVSSFANYNNAYSCKVGGELKNSGFDFILIQNSKYSGLNAHDESATIKIITELYGEFKINRVEVLGDGALPFAKSLNLTAFQDEEKNKHNILLTLIAKRRNQTVQESNRLTGFVYFNYIKNESLEIKTNFKVKLDCKKVL